MDFYKANQLVPPKLQFQQCLLRTMTPKLPERAIVTITSGLWVVYWWASDHVMLPTAIPYRTCICHANEPFLNTFITLNGSMKFPWLEKKKLVVPWSFWGYSKWFSPFLFNREIYAMPKTAVHLVRRGNKRKENGQSALPDACFEDLCTGLVEEWAMENKMWGVSILAV